MSKPIIAIVGIPNVGKSTFFNRILSKRHAIVDSVEGITRDRIFGEIEWCGTSLKIIDTGGYIPEDLDIFNKEIRQQVQSAMVESDLVVFMVDGKNGPNASDRKLSRLVRMSGKPCIVAVNKCDKYGTDNQIHQYHELGFENILPISALNGRLTGNLLDAIINNLSSEKLNNVDKAEKPLKLAIVGMPNVGKSSLTNALLQKNRSIVTPIAGTTRDAIDADLLWYGRNINLVDTAGLRRLAKLRDNLEYYSLVRTKKAIQDSDIVLVLIDAKKGLCKQDKLIIDDVIKKGKGLILVVNKWDLIEKETSTMNHFKKQLTTGYKSLEHYPIIFISALTTQRVHLVLENAWDLHKRCKNIISTKLLNQKLKYILSKNPPSADNGKAIQIKYATQVSTEPTVIAFYTNFPKRIKSQYRRYLENQLRRTFDLNGVSVILSFRSK